MRVDTVVRLWRGLARWNIRLLNLASLHSLILVLDWRASHSQLYAACHVKTLFIRPCVDMYDKKLGRFDCSLLTRSLCTHDMSYDMLCSRAMTKKKLNHTSPTQHSLFSS